MATSGAVTYNPTALELITEALQIIRVGIGGEALASEDTTDALRTLNLMITAWRADGLHLWTKSEAVLFLSADQASYDLGGSATDHCALASDVVQTTLSAAAVLGATTITLTDASEIAEGDHVGIELSDGTVQWTTADEDPSGSSLDLADALTGAASAAGIVYAYTTRLMRPARILSVRRRDVSADSDVPANIVERPDYFDLPNKSQSATITTVYYDPQLTTGKLYVWQASASETDTLRFTFERPLEQFDELTNTADVPTEWLEALTYNLAYRLAPKYSFPVGERQILRADALGMKEKLLGFDREYGSVTFQPDCSMGGGFGSFG